MSSRHRSAISSVKALLDFFMDKAQRRQCSDCGYGNVGRRFHKGRSVVDRLISGMSAAPGLLRSYQFLPSHLMPYLSAKMLYDCLILAPSMPRNTVISRCGSTSLKRTPYSACDAQSCLLIGPQAHVPQPHRTAVAPWAGSIT